MVYRNKKTGAMFETDCELSGKNWEVAPVQPKEQSSKEEPEEKQEEATAKETPAKRTTAKSTAKKTR